jgi:hypothetical protein
MKQNLKNRRHYNAISCYVSINSNYTNKIFSEGLKKGHLTHHRVKVSLSV